MPDEVFMQGDYTNAEIMAMSQEELYAAAQRGFRKPVDPSDAPALVPDDVPQPSGDVWMRRKRGQDVFTLPSGQTCRIREVTPEALLTAGILDRVTRLEGLAATLVAQAEGQPPAKNVMPSRKDFAELLSVINVLVPLAVAEPRVWPEPENGEEALQERLYPSDIELSDRLAIVEKALQAIRALDRFRHSR